MTGREASSVYHPRRNDQNGLVTIAHPSQPSPRETWQGPDAVAVFVPDGPVPSTLNGLPIAPVQPPSSAIGWGELVKTPGGQDLPPLRQKPGKKAAAGAVILEPDRRVWLYEPTNHYAGYHRTFPKGTQEAGYSLEATAAREVFEETGLLVEISAFLLDCDRSQSVTRFYLARRIGGSPSAMGWESQALWLVPMAQLRTHAPHRYDAPVVQAVLGLG